MTMHKFANPARFLRIITRLHPWLLVLALGLLGAGAYFALFASPADYQQGDSVRIMYVHVPAAWLATMVYGMMAAGAASFLIWRHPLADVFVSAAAPVGLVFTLLTLATGSLWGKPMWGTWWEWDARMTSVLIMFFIYLGFVMLQQSLPAQEGQKKVLAIFVLIGAVNLPIIKFSVEWWNTLHQPASIIRAEGPAIAPEMLLPLFLMMGGYFVFALMVIFLRMRGILTTQKITRLQSRYF